MTITAKEIQTLTGLSTQNLSIILQYGTLPKPIGKAKHCNLYDREEVMAWLADSDPREEYRAAVRAKRRESYADAKYGEFKPLYDPDIIVFLRGFLRGEFCNRVL
jgi:hypothetical protein